MLRAELRGAIMVAAMLALAVLTAASLDFGLPAQDWLQALRFHLAAVALVISLLLWTFAAPLRALAALLVIVASLAHGGWIILSQQRQRGTIDSATFRVLSFNVLASNEQGQSVADFMIDLDADLVAIMETPGIERALDRIAETFPYRVGCDASQTCDLSLFSRTPLLDAAVHLLGPLQRERLITARTTINGQGVTIVALHLSKPYFDGAAAAELWQISHIIKEIEGPFLITGDFNGTAWAGDIERLVRRNRLVPPPSYPATWPVELGAFGIPIDNMFTGGGLQIETIEATEEYFGSNHRGLIATVGMAQPGPASN